MTVCLSVRLSVRLGQLAFCHLLKKCSGNPYYMYIYIHIGGLMGYIDIYTIYIHDLWNMAYGICKLKSCNLQMTESLS